MPGIKYWVNIEVEGGNVDQYPYILLLPVPFSCSSRASSMNWMQTTSPSITVRITEQVLPGYMFTDTGFWDTFRCLFPLLNLMYPSVNKEMQEGLNQYV